MSRFSNDEIADRLQAFLAKETGGSARVEGLRAMPGGASRAAYAFDLDVAAGPWAGRHALVLRLDLGGKIYEASLERDEEFEVLARAAQGGVPVPRVCFRSRDPEALGRGFLVMERVDGETIGRRIVSLPELSDARKALPEQMGRALARIHALDPEPLGFLPRPWAGSSPARRVLDGARGELDRIGGAHPGLEAGFRWFEENAPESADRVLVHGDFRLGNMIVGPDGLRAVIDWEFASVGDPHEDLAWPFVRDWRFGLDHRRFGGISDGEDFFSSYEAASGRRIDRARAAYWEALGNFRWALGCLTQAHRHLSGAEPSVELASLGRRSAEMELEMLDRIAAIAAGSA